MKKIFWLVVLIIIIVVIVLAVRKTKTVPENSIITSNNTETTTSEKRVICNVGPEVESDWCKLPTGQQLLLGMKGDVVYDNGYYYSFSRNNIDQGVRLWKTDNFMCSDHIEMVECDNSNKLTVSVSGSRDFYNNILNMLKDTSLQTRKNTDSQ
jgi:signal peptidase I